MHVYGVPSDRLGWAGYGGCARSSKLSARKACAEGSQAPGDKGRANAACMQTCCRTHRRRRPGHVALYWHSSRVSHKVRTNMMHVHLLCSSESEAVLKRLSEAVRGCAMGDGGSPEPRRSQPLLVAAPPQQSPPAPLVHSLQQQCMEPAECTVTDQWNGRHSACTDTDKDLC